MSELEFRAAQVADVSFPERLIELIVMPYETETLIHERGRSYTEIVSKGAWAGIESRNGRVRVNRDHKVERTVGRAVTFHPSRQEGLIAELRISDTELGRETLTLADDGCLDASAGFAPLFDKATGRPVPNAEVWETRSRRRLNRLYLGHIALVPDPAYETAHVLAVRQTGEPAAVVASRNREQLDLERWRRLESDLDARYRSGQALKPQPS